MCTLHTVFVRLFASCRQEANLQSRCGRVSCFKPLPEEPLLPVLHPQPCLPSIPSPQHEPSGIKVATGRCSFFLPFVLLFRQLSADSDCNCSANGGDLLLAYKNGPHGDRTRHLLLAKQASPHCDLWPLCLPLESNQNLLGFNQTLLPS